MTDISNGSSHNSNNSNNAAVTKRMTALIDMLTAVGADSILNNILEREVDRCRPNLSKGSLPEEPQAWDSAVERLTKQLRDCREETPELFSLAEAPSEPARYSSPAYSPSMAYSTRPSAAAARQQQQQRPRPRYGEAQQQRRQAPGPDRDIDPAMAVDRREYLEREFSQTSYPKIGPGYSDSISVVSDLTIPTVMTGVHVPDEERYLDRGPPMSIGISISHKPNHLRRPSGRDLQRDFNQLKAPSRRVVTRSSADGPLQSPVQSQPPATQQPQTLPQQQPTTQPPLSRPEPPPLRSSGGAAAQRRHAHQAVLAQLESSHGTVTTAASTTPSSPATSTMNLQQHSHHTSSSAPMSINDFPSLRDERLNFFPSEDESSDHNSNGHVDGDRQGPGKRRSLLRKSNKYAASVSANSSRMLLNSSHKKATSSPKTARPYGGLMRRRGSVELDHQQLHDEQPDIDITGVLSTIGQDVDFLFRELSALEDNPNLLPAEKQNSMNPTKPPLDEMSVVSESNLGATARIKYTLGSVARTLRTGNENDQDEKKKPSRQGSYEDAKSNSPNPKTDPLLIDEDGFLISPEADPNGGAFQDPFAQTARTSGGSGGGGSGFRDPFTQTNTTTPMPAFGDDFMKTSPKRDVLPPSSKRKPSRRASLAHPGGVPSSSSPNMNSSNNNNSMQLGHQRRASMDMKPRKSHDNIHNTDSRIDAVEMETKKRIDMLRQLVAERSPMAESSPRSGGGAALHDQLNFVEAATMKQIAKLRDRLGESRRHLGVE